MTTPFRAIIVRAMLRRLRMIRHRIAAASCPSTRAVHRERAEIYRNTTAALLAEVGPAVGQPLPAVERIAKGE
jgi:hypothetical protein